VYVQPTYATTPTYSTTPAYGATSAASAPPTTWTPSTGQDFQREVVYPQGKYVLLGDGVRYAYQWIWVPAQTE
jgi:hypothetical protein